MSTSHLWQTYSFGLPYLLTFVGTCLLLLIWITHIRPVLYVSSILFVLNPSFLYFSCQVEGPAVTDCGAQHPYHGQVLHQVRESTLLTEVIQTIHSKKTVIKLLIAELLAVFGRFAIPGTTLVFLGYFSLF